MSEFESDTAILGHNHLLILSGTDKKKGCKEGMIFLNWYDTCGGFCASISHALSFTAYADRK